jgi:hypothetical protein
MIEKYENIDDVWFGRLIKLDSRKIDHRVWEKHRIMIC